MNTDSNVNKIINAYVYNSKELLRFASKLGNSINKKRTEKFYF